MRNLSLLFASLSLVYLGCTFVSPFIGDYIPKALPIVLLLAFSARVFSGRTRWLMLAALGFSATGDVVLNLGLFVPGLGAFLIAQLLYAVLFCYQAHWRRDRAWAYAAQLGFFLILCTVLIPRLGDMMVPVLAYMVAIGLMLVFAISHRAQTPLIALGAAMFVLSDSLIAIERFVLDLPLAGFSIMLTYYLAQWMIFAGVYQAVQAQSQSDLDTWPKDRQRTVSA